MRPRLVVQQLIRLFIIVVCLTLMVPADGLWWVFVSKLQAMIRAAMPELGPEGHEQLVSEQLTSFVVVRDLTDPALLGMDILQKVGATIECASGSLVVGGRKINTELPIKTRNQVSCAARSETFINIRRVAAEKPVLFCPEEVEGVSVASAVHLAHKGVPVRILNLSEEKVVIPAGTVLGTQESITEWKPLEEPEEETDRSQDPKLPSVDHLDPDNRTLFHELLQEYSDVFSQSPEDIGDYKGDPVLWQLIQHLKKQEVKTDKLTEDEKAELRFYTRLPDLRLYNGIIRRSSRGHQRPQEGHSVRSRVETAARMRQRLSCASERR
ncbi:hypothetical protein FJT64_019966 [Amphibalanus amphitrite]|uniref:Uncharacterized protein n=1 Tax=Amphibalanus amphitrite TaxID=1232801 RepID=A0A6A4X373_AMPAM|nr:hypothetical protein FJT64_019966 [Amphibalanus amphitrite]